MIWRKTADSGPAVHAFLRFDGARLRGHGQVVFRGHVFDDAIVFDPAQIERPKIDGLTLALDVPEGGCDVSVKVRVHGGAKASRGHQRASAISLPERMGVVFLQIT
jgi:hypothetical protein